MDKITRPIVTQIEDAVESIPGWSPIDQLSMLFALTLSSSHLEGDILEMGSWCGRSAVAIGMAARLSPNTRVFCVDLFPERNDWFANDDGSHSFSVVLDGVKYDAHHEQTVWDEPFQRDIVPVYDRFGSTLNAFTSAIEANNLQDVVLPCRGTMKTFSKTVRDDFKVRLAFVDGDHSFDAVSQDIRIINSFLVPGGWICFDDAFSSYEGVNDAIKTHIIDNPNYDCCQQLTRKFFVARKTR
ncbi:class I SAM-dependent methyltransferase [Coralliovum pocilloporae]|uniref:class I SAM-dependent methyltransferase n=1 Tax=Coralliovum pocilloporae TaxID=3066369 RepID=UPI003306E241